MTSPGWADTRKGWAPAHPIPQYQHAHRHTPPQDSGVFILVTSRALTFTTP